MLNLTWLNKSWIYGFWPFLTPSGCFLGLDLFQNMFHNLLMYTNNFCFGYIAVSCFFETFPGVAGWLAVWLENPILMKTKSSVWTWTMDFDLGFVNICLELQPSHYSKTFLYFALIFTFKFYFQFYQRTVLFSILSTYCFESHGYIYSDQFPNPPPSGILAQ